MFLPKQFEITDQKTIYSLIQDFSFASLISVNTNGIQASHLPLVLSHDKKFLIGHMAIANVQWKDLTGKEMLAIFQGPHHYISPSWYETKDAVPTWNYLAVHVYGKFSLMENETFLTESLSSLVDKFESMESEYLLDNANPEYLANLRNGIIGFQIEIQKMEAKAKLSQNHSKERQISVIQNLKKQKTENAEAIATWMQKNIGI